MKFRQFLGGLSIFIIGSLILTFIISLGSLKSVGDSIRNIAIPTTAKIQDSLSNASIKIDNASRINTPNIIIPKSNYVQIIPSQMDEYSVYKELYKSCSGIDAMGQSQGVSDLRSTACHEACGKRNMNYGYYSCDRDLLTCYCSP